MTNENDSDTPISDSPSQSPPQAPVIPPAPLQGTLPDDGKRKADDTKNEADELAREFRAAEKWVIGTNITLAIIGIFALCIYYCQLKVMRGQLGEIIRQYPQLQKSAQAAADGAGAAQSQLVKMDESNRINREALESVQRAFVIFPAMPKFSPPIQTLGKGTYYSLEIPIQNVGATQAQSLRDRVSCAVPMHPLPDDYTFPDKSGQCGTPHVASGAN